jgi:rare lipoprotein A
MNKIKLTLILCAVLVGIANAEPTKWVGFASYYTVKSSSEWTASGERYDENAFTCAIWNVPFNTIIKVTNIVNGKFVLVRVNDRGVAKRLLKKGRIIDLTPRAFKELAPLSQGLVRVKLEVIK